MRCACVATVSAMIVSYGFATTQGRIASDVFPIISETFLGTPQSYVSEFALGFAAWTLCAMTVVTRAYLDAYACDDEVWRGRNRRRTPIGMAASIMLALTAAINYEESWRAHATCAFGFLFALWIWFTGVTRQLWAHQGSVSAWSMRMKVFACASALVGVGGFTSLSAAAGKETAYSWLGACEWLGVLSLTFACWTVSWDFDAKGVTLAIHLQSPAPAAPRVGVA